MELITLIQGDSGDAYEFSSKQVSVLDTTWSGSWTVSDTLGGTPIINGNLIKNTDILNNDSLVNEDFNTTYKIFNLIDELLILDTPVISGTSATITGKIYKNTLDSNGVTVETPVANKYAYITIKGIFVTYTRTIKVKSDANGLFSAVFDLTETIKTPANSFFVFQISPLQSEVLSIGDHILSIEVKQTDSAGNIIFRREVLQAKLRVTGQGVL